MSDLSITASQVQPGADGDFYDGTAGEAVTAGQPCYLDTEDNKLYLAAAGAKTTARVKGVALHGAALDQPLRLQTTGTITLGAAAAIAAGTQFWLSETDGGIAPVVDLTAGGMYGTYLGVGNASNGLAMHIHVTDIVLDDFDTSP